MEKNNFSFISCPYGTTIALTNVVVFQQFSFRPVHLQTAKSPDRLLKCNRPGGALFDARRGISSKLIADSS
jgi:hypothetical protein